MPGHHDDDTDQPTDVTAWNVLIAALFLALLLGAMMLWAVRFMSCLRC